MRGRTRHLARAWLVLALVATPVLPTAWAQEGLDQRVGPGSPATEEAVPLYRPEPDKIIGRTSLPDPKTSVLVQPEGREWRAFRTRVLSFGAAAVILGIVALLAAFYLYRGTIRIESGRSGRTVLRFGSIERFAHWLTATSFIVLALTGLVVTFGRPLLIPLIGHQAFTPLAEASLAEASKYAHNFFSVPLVLGLVLILGLWLRDNVPERADLEWIRQGGGMMRGGGVHPEAGRFNAGQKMIFWSVVLGGLVLAVTGYLLMLPFYVTGIGGMQVTHAVHAVIAALLIMVAIAHVYIGTIGMEGAFDAMASGQVDENWAREHHSRWYEEVRKRGGTDAPSPPHGAGVPAE
jgi:formate dehydrogenase subunit gamma